MYTIVISCHERTQLQLGISYSTDCCTQQEYHNTVCHIIRHDKYQPQSTLHTPHHTHYLELTQLQSSY